MEQYDLSLGPDVIQLLIPHRRPFLMVDRVTFFALDPAPLLRAVKHLSANEPFFAGHFPQIALMPGALTFEGLGQTANILSVLLRLRERYIQKNLDPASLPEALHNVERGFSLSPAYQPKKTELLRRLAAEQSEPQYGLVGSVNMKFLEPITAGCVVEYEAELQGVFESYLHYRVAASVDGRTKAKGTMSSIRGFGVKAAPKSDT
jgi:3-hydroxyacyl-[acyl-carrier-protein] dehydratase